MKPRPTQSALAGSRYLQLQRLGRAQQRSTAELLQLYVLESFLRRVVRSPHDERLVLKGGMLLAAFDLHGPPATWMCWRCGLTTIPLRSSAW